MPLGFSKVYSGTNKAAYRADDVMKEPLIFYASRMMEQALQRMPASVATRDVGRGYRFGPFPMDAQFSGGLYWGKSSAASSTARAWRLFGDSQGFYLFVNQDGA